MNLKKLLTQNLKRFSQVSRKLPKGSARFVRVALLLLIAALLGYFGRPLLFAASVNGQFITRYKLIRELEKQGGQQTLDNLVTKAIIFQEAKNKGVGVSQEEIDSELTRIEGIVSQQGSTLDQALALQGQTRQDLMEQIRLQKSVEKLLADKLVVTAEEVKTYWDENKELYGEDSQLEEVSQEIKDTLMQEKLTTSYQPWISELKSAAKINYFVEL